MNKKKTALFTIALSSFSLCAFSDNAFSQSQKMEKCFGIVKAGLNDCANSTGTHSCASLGKKDKDPAEWMLLPEGTCKKIVGGILHDESSKKDENPLATPTQSIEETTPAIEAKPSPETPPVVAPEQPSQPQTSAPAPATAN